jgi:hypothetical protein
MDFNDLHTQKSYFKSQSNNYTFVVVDEGISSFPMELFVNCADNMRKAHKHTKFHREEVIYF